MVIIIIDEQLTKKNKGQLGDGTCISRLVPTKVVGLEGRRIIKIACAWCHSMALDDNGRVYTWGHNASGK